MKTPLLCGHMNSILASLGLVAAVATCASADTGVPSDYILASPTLFISNVSKYEGNSGTTKFVFTVRLSQRSNSTVTVKFMTVDESATTADNDYVAVSGTLTFRPRQTSKEIVVRVKGDRTREGDELFLVQLLGSVGATISDGTGVGTIRNDDGRRRRDDDDASEHVATEPEFARPTVFPNPARGNATLAFSTMRRGPVRVDLLDVAGRLVSTLADGSEMPAGNHRFAIGSGSVGGARLNPGIYFYRVQSPDKVTTGRLVILE